MYNFQFSNSNEWLHNYLEYVVFYSVDGNKVKGSAIKYIQNIGS